MKHRKRLNITRWFRRFLAAIPRMWRRFAAGPGWKKLLVRQAFYLLAALCSGLLIVYVLPLKHHSLTSTSTTKNGSQYTQPAPVGPAQTNQLFATHPTWAQDFGSGKINKLDSHFWEALIGPAQNSNNEAEYYTNDTSNLRIENGALTLQATHQPEPDGYSYASARIDTQGKKSFLYGRLDVTAKVPRGVGTWPAVWLLPANNTYEKLSPASDTARYKNGGEIDLIEAVGFNPNVEYGVVHTVTDLTRTDGVGSYNQLTIPDNDKQYNLYTMLWTPTSITFEINNKPFYTYTKAPNANYVTWPFNQPFYLILNLAMGGSWGGQDTADFPGNGIDNSALPASLDVQSIYYYPYVGK